jgi:hypothetical protein
MAEEKIISDGICNYCKKTFLGRAMKVHLKSCKERIDNFVVGNKRIFLIKVSCEPFWIYFEINSESTLEDIDKFLRDIWLECCWHLSLFRIDDIVYSSDEGGEFDDKSISTKLSNVLSVGKKFYHEYDFGTTTYLMLEVISERTGSIKDIDIIARNNIPKFKCKCGKPTENICSQCIYEGKGFLCKECSKTHECGEDSLLPYVNSPRTGFCGYTGEV